MFSGMISVLVLFAEEKVRLRGFYVPIQYRGSYAALWLRGIYATLWLRGVYAATILPAKRRKRRVTGGRLLNRERSQFLPVEFHSNSWSIWRHGAGVRYHEWS